MLTPAHPLRSRFSPLWQHRRQLQRARLCALLTGLVLSGAAVALRGWEPRAAWQSEGQERGFVGVSYVAETVETPAAAHPAPRKVLVLPAVPPSAPPALAVSAELPEPEPLREQESAETLPEESEPFSLEVVAPAPPSPRPAAEHRRAMAAAAEAPLTPPAYREAPKPPYPPTLRARRICGSVGVRIAVSAEGVPTEVIVTTPDAHTELARIVRRWILEHWRFQPARRGDAPVASTVQTRVDFVLD